jgi:hypothetical protein
MKTLATILGSLLVLAGCAGFLPPEHEAMLSSASPCCEAFSGLPFRELENGRLIRAFVGPDTPAFLFPEGKSYFLALRPKRSVNGSTLVVRTFAQNMLYNRDGHVFVPRVTFLSDRYEVISSISPDFTVQGPKYGTGESSWRVDLLLPLNAVYVVVHTSGEERSRTMLKRDSGQVTGYLSTRTGPAGEIEVELR